MNQDTQTEATPDQAQGINISLEQVLAAVLKTLGKTTVNFEDLTNDYSAMTIAVTQNEDRSVTFELATLPDQATNSESVLEVEAE
jgi:hypothetical protein